jgi:hypothetical protein
MTSKSFVKQPGKHGLFFIISYEIDPHSPMREHVLSRLFFVTLSPSGKHSHYGMLP